MQVLDLYFMEARSKLLDLAAFLDRVDRGTGEPDFRLAAFKKALHELDLETSAERVPSYCYSYSYSYSYS